MKKNKILVINGPNLNLLGRREPEIYGTKTLEEIQKWTDEKMKKSNVALEWIQSNSEEKIIEKLHKIHSENKYKGLIINPGGLSHTSIVLLDALLAIKKIPIAEVHLSNPCSREEFRRQMLTAKASTIIMGGVGFKVYYFAALALCDLLTE